ncbi:MAG: efflux RND transporter permease subunit [Myxococcota bacterium]
MYRLTKLTLDHRGPAAAILATVTIVLALGLPKVRTVHGFRILIGEDHPVVRTLDEMTERFGGSRPLEIGWSCGDGAPCRHALDRSSLEVARDLTSALEDLPQVRRVLSPANAALLVPSSEGFVARRLVEHGQIIDDLESLLPVARHDTLWKERLISPDLASAIVIVAPADATIETEDALFDELNAILAKYEQRGFSFNLNGALVRTIESGRALQQSTARILPSLVLVIAIVLLAASGSPRSVALALATMGVAVLWTIGLMGWLDWPQDGIHQVLAPLILIVGLCDAVHLLTRASELRGTSRDRLLSATRFVGAPCILTTATTAVALASFTTSDLEAFVRFGAISAAGVIFCLALTFSLLPLVATVVPVEHRDGHSRSGSSWADSLLRFSRYAERRPIRILCACGLLVGYGILGITTHLRVDTDWRQAFGETGNLSRWAMFFEGIRGSSDTLEVELEAAGEHGVLSNDALTTLSTLSSNLTELDGLGASFGLLDLLARVDAALAGDAYRDPAMLTDARRAAELVELVSFDDPESLEPWLTLDRSATRISFEASWLAQSEIHLLMEQVRSVIDATVPRDWSIRLGGIMALDDVWVRDVQTTQLRSFPTAFLFVFALSSLFLRSFRLGLIAMLPSLIAIVVTLGTMGWLGMGLDIGRAMIGAVVIGIGVDDAIHFLDAHRRHLTRGANRHEAVDLALADTGRAIITTSIALALGFLTLMASAWQTISSFGFFVSITIVAALVATLFLLPALLAGFGEQAGAER